MTSREKILQEIKNTKPAEVPLPDEDKYEHDDKDLKQEFINTLTGIGGICLYVDSEKLDSFIHENIQHATSFVQTIKKLPQYNADAYRQADASSLQDINTVYIKGGLAVAENGAVWVSETNMVNRLLPFICEHFVLVINENDIVATMHDAYDKITTDEDGYGTFIAGPSKTADIEQSLVIGAHGPLSLLVIIIKNA